MQPSIGDLALTMRHAIAKALAEAPGGQGPGLLGYLDVGLAAITAAAGGTDRLDPTPLPAPGGGELPPAGAGAFEDYLRDRTGNPTLRLDAVERISGGFSRDMIRLRCTNDGSAYSLVVRREVPGGLLEGISLGVAGEYPLMEVAAGGHVPVAAPLWLETDAGVLGQPFVVMACAAGECLGTSLGAAGRIAEPQLQALAAMLATLHRVPLPTGAAIERNPALSADQLLDHWQAYWKLTPLSPVPLLDDAMRWLRAHLPGDGHAPCLNHGDVGFHNIMADETGFTALLDWEMAVFASPAKDIAHVRPSVEQLAPWSDFLTWYREAGGADITASELQWFEVFRAFSMTLVCHVALAKLADPAAARIDYFRLAFVALPVFSAQLAALIAQVAG